MRLTCPGCKAQYEVPAEVIPAVGREVQCSNCNAIWFQDPETKPEPEGAPRAKIVVRPKSPAAQTPEQDREDTAPGPTPPETTPTGPTATARQPQPAPAAPQPDLARPAQRATTQPSPANESPGTTMPASATASAPTRRKLDPAVADVLREEAELEARRRNEMVGSVESQPELGLTGRAPIASQPSETVFGRPPAAPPETPSPTSPPPVSSMFVEPPAPTPAKDTVAEEAPAPAPEVAATGSTKRGFTWVIALAAICVLVYAFAPQIAEAVPETDPWLSTYVTKVDAGRVWLDGRFQDLLAWLDTVLAQEGSE